MRGSRASGSLMLEFAGGRDIVVLLDKDDLIYWADEYFPQLRFEYPDPRFDHWQADAT